MTFREMAIGIDIGGTNLRAARVSGSGEIIDHVHERTMRDPQITLKRIVELVRRLDTPSVKSIGIGAPGRVDIGKRMVLSGGYIDLSSIALAAHVEQAIGKPVFIDNDCNMALIAEIAVGAARGRDNIAMFTIGTGIGGAVYSDGKIVRGHTTAGQLGHITVDSAGERCNCGRLGCIETLSSGTALGRHIAEAGFSADTSVDRLFELDAQGHAAARDVLRKWARPLRSAIESLVAVADPDLVLLGGGLGTAAHRALAYAPAPAAWFQCEVEAALLGDDAGVIGAAFSSLALPSAGDLPVCKAV